MKKPIAILLIILLVAAILFLTAFLLVFFKVIEIDAFSPFSKSIISKIPVISSLVEEEYIPDLAELEKLELIAERQIIEGLLNSLKEKEQKLAQQELVLENWEITLMEQESLITILIAELEGKTQDIKRISKIYESMKPKDAAEVLMVMNDDSIISILGQMSVDSIANILTQVDPGRAAIITEKMKN